MISLVQLQYIVAVDTYRHFATAAEKSFVTQPTLSMQIKKMEEALGVKIFDRSKQPVVPTDIGKSILEQARVVLSEYGKINQLVDDYTGNIGGELKVGIIPTLASTLLPSFIGKLCNDHPNVKVSIWERQTEHLVEMLNQDLLDVAIVVTPLQDDAIKEKTIGYEGIKVYAHAKHELAQAKEVTLADLQRPDIWLLSNGHCFRNQVINLCAYQGFSEGGRNLEYASGSLETLRRLVEEEGGFTLLPEMYIASMPKGAKGVVMSLAGDLPLRQISLVYTRNFVKEKLLGVFYDYLCNAIPQSMRSRDHGFVVEWNS